MVEVIPKVPPEAWIGLGGIIFGSILSIIGVWLSNRASNTQLQIQLLHEKETKRSYIQIEKMEELYVIFEAWTNNTTCNALSITGVMRGKQSYNEYLDWSIDDQEKQKHDFKRLEMIINIYADDLKPSYLKVMEKREALNGIEIKHKQAYSGGDTDGERFVKPYVAAQMELERIATEFKSLVAQNAKNA